jgi:hypothetical protein
MAEITRGVVEPVALWSGGDSVADTAVCSGRAPPQPERDIRIKASSRLRGSNLPGDFRCIE